MGVNVYFWGPCGWRIVFAIGKVVHVLLPRYRAAPETVHRARALVAWACTTLRAFFRVLCCVFCRRSCPEFVRELEESSGKTMEEHVFQGHALRFLYDLRAKVNMKLHAQHLRSFGGLSGVTFSPKACSIPPRTIRFDTWRDRLMLQHSMFQVQDVELLLNALRLDYLPSCAEAYATLLDGLGVLAHMESAIVDAPHNLHAPMRLLAQLLRPLGRLARMQPEMLDTRAGYERVLVQLMSGMRGYAVEPDTYEREAKRLFAPYAIMQAGVQCRQETCDVPEDQAGEAAEAGKQTGRREEEEAGRQEEAEAEEAVADRPLGLGEARERGRGDARPDM